MKTNNIFNSQKLEPAIRFCSNKKNLLVISLIFAGLSALFFCLRQRRPTGNAINANVKSLSSTSSSSTTSTGVNSNASKLRPHIPSKPFPSFQNGTPPPQSPAKTTDAHGKDGLPPRSAAASSSSSSASPTKSVLKGQGFPKGFQDVLAQSGKIVSSIKGGCKKCYPIDSENPWIIKEYHRLPWTIDYIFSYMATEILLYEASKQLGLRVLPKIRYIAPDSEEDKLIKLKDPSIYPDLVQAYVTPTTTEIPLDVPHAQKVVLFNWLVGRQDCKSENSAIDRQGRVWEIDNDSPMGIQSLKDQSRDRSWLEKNDVVMKRLINEETIVGILALPDQIVLSHRFIPESDGGRLEEITQKLNENLAMVKAAIRSLQNQQAEITLAALNQELSTQIQET